MGVSRRSVQSNSRRCAREEFILLNEAGLHGPPRDVPVKCDDILEYHMEICGPSGHYSEITVNCAYREPTELESKLMDAELKAYDAIKEIAKPGIRISELAQTFEKVLLDDGWKFGPPKNHFDFHGQGQDVVERPWPHGCASSHQGRRRASLVG